MPEEESLWIKSLINRVTVLVSMLWYTKKYIRTTETNPLKYRGLYAAVVHASLGIDGHHFLPHSVEAMLWCRKALSQRGAGMV